MANQIPRSDDVQFWSRQLTEHALFLSLLLQEQPWRRQAEQLYALWLDPRGDVMGKTNELIAYKQAALTQLRSGAWLGWCLPSFLQHILDEALYFRTRMGPGTQATTDCAAWSKIVMEHALIGPKLIDPNASLQLAAAEVAAKIMMLQGCCSSPNHQCLTALDNEFQKTNAWVRGLPIGAHIIPPTLTAHIIRENDRASQTMRLMGGG